MKYGKKQESGSMAVMDVQDRLNALATKVSFLADCFGVNTLIEFNLESQEGFARMLDSFSTEIKSISRDLDGAKSPLAKVA